MGTVYLVTGVPRSGLSCITAALSAGGIEVAPDDGCEFDDAGWLQARTGRVAAVPIDEVYNLPSAPTIDYRAVLMIRNLGDVVESMIAHGDPVPVDQRAWRIATAELCRRRRAYLRKRPDVYLRVLALCDLRRQPRAMLTELYDHGWPIRVGDAATAVQKTRPNQ